MTEITDASAATPSVSERRRLTCARIALVLLVAVVFGRCIGYDYLRWDDDENIFENPIFRPVTASVWLDAWTRTSMEIYMPVTRTLWAALAAGFGGRGGVAGDVHISVSAFRVVSLAIHAASSLLVLAILRRLGFATAVAAIGAALFAVHPVQVEAVAWISGQKDLLATFFTLAACHLSLTAVERRHRSWTLATWIAAVAAMLSKPQAVTAPLIVLAALRAVPGVTWRQCAALALPPLVAAVALAIVARLHQPAERADIVPLLRRPLVALDAIGFYATSYIWPVNLTVDYGRRPLTTWTAATAPVAVLGLLIMLLLAGAAIVKRDRLIVLGMISAIAGVLPVLGFLSFEFQYTSTVSDHYAYAASFGAVLTVLAASRNAPVQRPLFAAGLIIVGTCAALSVRQTATWRDTQTLFERNLELVPTSFAARSVLANLAVQRGEDRLAIDLANGALQSHPDDPRLLFGLAESYRRLGDVAEAQRLFERSIAHGPTDTVTRLRYAVMLIDQNQLEAAEHQLRAILALQPDLTHVRELLAWVQRKRVTAVEVPTTRQAGKPSD